jgi:hypothetical protein
LIELSIYMKILIKLKLKLKLLKINNQKEVYFERELKLLFILVW